MRKHFLLLFLMALLPLAGFAAVSISTASVAVADIEYGQTTPPTVVVGISEFATLVENTDYERDGYYVKNGDAYISTTLSTLPAGQTAYVKVVGIGAYDGFAYGEFQVAKATVTLKIQDAAFFTKVFKGEDPEIVANDVHCVVHGTEYDNSTNAKQASKFLTITAASLGYSYGDNQNVTTTGYAITFSGIALKDASNYVLDITTNARKMFITPAVINNEAETLFAFTPEEAVDAYTYDGLAAGQAPTYGITWDDDDDNTTAATTLVEGTDFYVKYYGEGDEEGSLTKPVNADTYTVKVFGKGNYTTPTNNNDTPENDDDDIDNAGVQIASYGFRIKKANMTVMPIAQTKKYDGEEFDLTTAKWNITGRVGADVQKTITGLRAVADAGVVLDSKKGDYKITAEWLGVDAQAAQEAGYVEANNVSDENFEDLKDNLYVLNFQEATEFEEGTQYYSNDGGDYSPVEIADAAAFDAFNGDLFVQKYLPVGTADFDGETAYYTQTPAQDAVEGVPAAMIGDLELTKNYNVSVQKTTWKIEARPLTITVPGIKMKKGDANFPALVDDQEEPQPLKVSPAEEAENSGALEADAADIIAAFEVAYDNAEGGVLWVPATEGDDPVEAHAMTAAEVQIPGYAEAIIGKKIVYQSENEGAAYYDADAAAKNTAIDALLANYAITWSKGTLTVNGADFTIMPVVQNTIEYGEDYEIGFFAYNPLTNEEVYVPATAVEFQINGEDYTELPTDRGTYTVTIKPNAAMGTDDYLGGTITLMPGSFTIIKRHLTLEVADVKLHKNDPSTILASKADFEITEADQAVLTKMGESISLVYSFDTDKVDIDATTGKVKGFKAEQNGENAILAVLAEGGDNDNYEIEDYTKGDLTFFDANALAITANTDNAVILEAANNGSEDYSVSLELDRTLAGGKWNVLVLPFAIKPLDFCTATDTYAIFDVLTSVDKENRTFKFSLKLDEIPANTPFLVKPQADIKFKLNATDYLTFADCKIEYMENPGVEINETGVKFIGTYSDLDVDYSENPGQIMYMGSKYEFVTCEGRTKDLTIASTRAYLDYTGSGIVGARIFVEEADGSTTAISSINADGVAVPADGWYTLNGVKLQAAPVEKGVYINNGKKVVIK